LNDRILIVSSGTVHPPLGGRIHLRKLIREHTGGSVKEIRGLKGLSRRNLSRFSAMILYYHHRDDALPPEDLAAFNAFVDSGGGVLAIHSATASYKKTPAYFDVLGGRFTGHGPVEFFRLSPVSSSSGSVNPFTTVPEFEVTDELYLHENSEDITVHMETVYQGEKKPMVWTKTRGEGRVCYIGPGHRSKTMKQARMGQLILIGLDWTRKL